MTFYFFYQEDPKQAWTLALASDRDRIVKETKPALCTALDVSNNFEKDLTAAEVDALHYRGDFYADFDGQTIEEVIPQTQQFLINLKAKGLNLNSVRLYATGGRGFHVFVPHQCLFAKMPAGGIKGLPHMYREVAQALYVETLDLRIYSAKKGRQMRQANVERENGKFKVQISVEELFAMTPESYADVTSAPRPPLAVDVPVLTPELALLYSTSADKVSDAIKKRKSKKGAGAAALKGFGGKWPETLKRVLMGDGLKESAGFNQIAMQLAIAAVALGKGEDEFLNDAQGLIDTYVGDGSRYRSPAKRRQQLRDQYRYHDSNVCSEFSIGGIMSILDDDARANSDLTNGDYVPTEEAKQDSPEEEDDSNAGVKLDRTGIYVKAEWGWSKVSDIGFANPLMLMEPSKDIVGYEVEVFVGGESAGRDVVTHNMLASKSALQTFTLSKSCSLRASDVQTSMLADLLRKRTKKMGEIALITGAVGIDIVAPPMAKTPDDYEIIWSSPDEVISLSNNKYRYRPTIDNKASFFSDLNNAEDLTVEDADMIDDLFSINSSENVARLVGWYVAAFLSPILRKFYGKQFPSLQVYGPAGAGKTQTIQLLNHLHYHMKSPRELSAAGQTHFPIIAAMATSSSLPVVIEELKPRELSKNTYDFLLNIFRGNYNALGIARGSLSKDSGATGTVVNDYANRAPLVFVGEAMETQTAMMARCVMVSLAEQDRAGCEDAFFRSVARNTQLGRLGKAILYSTLALNVPEFRAKFDEIHSEIDRRVKAEGKIKSRERPVYNLAVVGMGLEFLRNVLHGTFGNRFDAKIESFIDTIAVKAAVDIVESKSEIAKTLDVMAQLTRSQDLNFKLVNGQDYTVDEESDTVDIKLKPVYAKYVRYMRSLGMLPLFDSDLAFITALSRYEGVVAKACPDNLTLFNNAFDPIFRISRASLTKEQNEPFEP